MAISEAQRSSLSASMRARTSAIRRLVENHRDEYDNLLGEARVENGLPRDATASNQQAKREKEMTRLQGRFEKLQTRHAAEMEKLQKQMLELQDGRQ